MIDCIGVFAYAAFVVIGAFVAFVAASAAVVISLAVFVAAFVAAFVAFFVAFFGVVVASDVFSTVVVVAVFVAIVVAIVVAIAIWYCCCTLISLTLLKFIIRVKIYLFTCIEILLAFFGSTKAALCGIYHTDYYILPMRIFALYFAYE